MKKVIGIIALGLIIACTEKTTDPAISKDNKKTSQEISNLFEQIPSSISGITFANTLKENVGTIENLFDFDYFYNGAGVGIVDINNDGLQDLFFAGNQVDNKLYLNKGNLQFEDISDSAGINVGKQWANGVTFADVNNDGWMDIYVSQGGPRQAAERSNLLFLNEEGVRFRESAKNLNIADDGISTQSIFFDYDNDGDLDLVVSNENEFYGLDPKRFFKTMEIEKNLIKSSIQLYENTGNSYVKVTKKAGLLRPAFGLGPIVSDINNDGLLDIYIANDYYVPDVMYINNGNGTFTDKIKEQTKQVSFYGMGVDIADINNDNLQDIFVLDMAASDHVRSKTLMASMSIDRFNLLVDDFGFVHQYMFNSLQLNQGNGKFHNVVQQANMAKTDWSWAGLIADLDNDTKRDVYVTNGYRRYALDNDLQRQVKETQRAFQGKVPLDVKQKLYDAMPTEKLSNIMFQNEGEIQFKNVAYQWGLSVPSYSNGGAYADLDNDGDLELVVSNIDDEAFLFKNNASEMKTGNYLRIGLKGNTSEPFAKITIQYGNQEQIYEAKRTKGYLSSTENVAHFGLGSTTTVDKISVQWLSGKVEYRTNVNANSILLFDEADALETSLAVFEKHVNSEDYAFAKANPQGLQFTHKEDAYNDYTLEMLLPYKQSTLGPSFAKGDVNGDGLEDIYVGGASGQAGELFLQTPTGFKKSSQRAFINSAASEDMESLFFDADGDGDQDLVIISGGNSKKEGAKEYKNRLYVNTDGVFTQSDLGIDATSSKSVTAIDYDADGDMDLIVGNRIQPQHFPVRAPSLIYRNDKGVFTDVTASVAPGLKDFGIVNKVITTDFDADGDSDFMVVGEWTHIGMFQNTNGVFEDVSKSYGVDQEKGWWFTITETDVNKDGLADYVVGNIGANVKYKASVSKPFKVFASDFDDNGSFDIVLSNEYNGNYVPARGKECSTQQMPFVSDKFETYADFANATVDDIYGDKLLTAYQKEVNTFESKLLLNTGDGNFEVIALPALAQMAPILDIMKDDVNGDGFEDLMVVGNIYEAEVETPRYDTGSGILLISDTKGGYMAINPATNGLYIEGNAKSLMKIKHVGTSKNMVLVGVNNGPLQAYEMKW